MSIRLLITMVLVPGIFSVAALAQVDRKDSIYTALNESKCKKLKPSGDGVLYRAECPGVGGYKLIHLGGDHRDTIQIVSSRKKTLDVDLWSGLSAAPGSLGSNVEWRVFGRGKSARPVALIVRVNVRPDPDNSGRVESSLVVVKLRPDSACVTDVVAHDVSNQNVVARQYADAAETRPCAGASGI